MQPALPFTLHTKKTKLLGLLLGSSAFTALGIWLALRGKHEGWFCAAFFGLGIPISLAQLHPRASYLTVTKDGFEFCALFRKTHYRWSDISEFGTYQLRGNGASIGTFVGFNFSSDSPAAPKRRDLSAALVGYEGGLPDSYGLSPEDLALLLSSYHAEYGRKS